MFWVSMSCLLQFVNSIVWHGNVLNPSPRYCDFGEPHPLYTVSMGISEPLQRSHALYGSGVCRYSGCIVLHQPADLRH
jgi:hypothetical protein